VTATPTPADAPAAVGAYVLGPPDSPRGVVRWLDQLRDYHELADDVDPDREAYLTVFQYPRADYCQHFVRAGFSARGYAGPAGCPYLVFDIDRKGDLAAALAGAKTLARALLARYGPEIDDSLAAYLSGAKGFHFLMPLPSALTPTPAVPATCRRLALAIAERAGVTIDAACYDHQRIFRLPNSRHPRTGLYKRYLDLRELFLLNVPMITDLARHPAAFPLPGSGVCSPQLEKDWVAASAAPARAPAAARPTPPSGPAFPVVPKFVRDFVGFADIQDPGRALTLFRCAAALAEAFELHGPDGVIRGLLAEVALKTGLERREVEKQIRDGIARGRRKGGSRG
jgi:hypothetical protein